MRPEFHIKLDALQDIVNQVMSMVKAQQGFQLNMNHQVHHAVMNPNRNNASMNSNMDPRQAPLLQAQNIQLNCQNRVDPRQASLLQPQNIQLNGQNHVVIPNNIPNQQDWHNQGQNARNGLRIGEANHYEGGLNSEACVFIPQGAPQQGGGTTWGHRKSKYLKEKVRLVLFFILIIVILEYFSMTVA